MPFRRGVDAQQTVRGHARRVTRSPPGHVGDAPDGYEGDVRVLSSPPTSLWGRVGRFAVASVVATVVTELSFLALYGADLAGAEVAGVIAFVAGAVPKFVLSRWWVWRRPGTPSLLGEVVPYGLIAAGTGLAAGLVTGLAERVIEQQVESRPWQVGLVGAAFLATMVLMFAVRYVLFDRLVFNDGSRTRRPR
jgi:putative flippase GtrA